MGRSDSHRFSALFGVLPGLETDDCPLEQPVMRQIFAPGEKAGRRQPLSGLPEDEGADDVRRQLRRRNFRSQGDDWCQRLGTPPV